MMVLFVVGVREPECTRKASISTAIQSVALLQILKKWHSTSFFLIGKHFLSIFFGNTYKISSHFFNTTGLLLYLAAARVRRMVTIQGFEVNRRSGKRRDGQPAALTNGEAVHKVAMSLLFACLIELL
jgi:hypothetical protein